MSSNDEGFSSSENLSTGEPIGPSKNGIEYQGLDIVETKPLLMDNKQVYYRGFLSMTDEEKARVMLGMLLTNQDPILNNLDDLNPSTLIERNNISKDNKLFKLKFYGLIGLIGIVILTAIAIIGTFLYLSLDKGVLDENGVLSGILNTLTEAIKILFSDPTSSPL
jgi:hypothetical protein